MTGSCLGGIIYPIIMRRLTDDIGSRWAAAIMTFIMLGTLVISIAVMRPRLPPHRSGPLINVEVLKDPVFATWLLAIFFYIYLPVHSVLLH